MDAKNSKAKVPQKVLDFRKDVSKILHKKSSNSRVLKQAKILSTVEGDEFNFCTDMNMNDYSCSEYTEATAKKVVKNIPTKSGSKNLVVWVENDELNNNTVTQSMVDKLANTFLQSGDDNDIYDWDTNVFGKAWGSDASSISSNLIGDDNTINILIYNMNSNNMAGYFWSKDNFKRSSLAASNEKIMFYIKNHLQIQPLPSD